MQTSTLKDFAENVHSQYGEDGIVREVLRRISCQTSLDQWCVEFGAWDGMYLSNTYRLIQQEGYNAVLIEGDPQRHQVLCGNLPQTNVHKICRFVTFEADSTLDAILKTTPIPESFDFLSIDIDGCDFYILESLRVFKPKVICIEFNPSIPNEVDFVQPCDFSIKQGCSPKALARLAKLKGYTVVAATTCNLILVRADLAASVLGNTEPTLDELRNDSDCKVFLFFGFDGTLLSNAQSLKLPWHNVEKPIERLQVLPKVLRKYSGDYRSGHRKLFRLWSAFSRLRRNTTKAKKSA
ncbi:MAG: hypothetical protein U0930_16795 [Pirellulales bacterium]